jgi:hypothetical protein
MNMRLNPNSEVGVDRIDYSVALAGIPTGSRPEARGVAPCALPRGRTGKETNDELVCGFMGGPQTEIRVERQLHPTELR